MVVARETTLQELLEGSKQYQIPLYQRTYSWSEKQLVRLWADIVQLAIDRQDDDRATHFIGSLVLAPSPSNGPTGVAEYLVIDGQQRLTTLSLLLCALRNHRRDHEDPLHFERISEQYLVNKWEKGDQKLKLLPTQTDRESFRACVEATPAAGGPDGVGASYRFFKSRLAGIDEEDEAVTLQQIEDAVISGLSVVCVTTQLGDNTHRIFESLNNTGLRLTQGDLIRNYLFMRLPTQSDSVYHSVWLPLQNMLSPDELELLFWLDLVQRDPTIKQSDTYARQQARLDRLHTEDQIKAEIERFAHLGNLWRTILSPETETDAEVSLRLHRLNEWGTTTVFPLLLHLMERRSRGESTSEQIARAMLHLESFLVRRLLVGRATMNINRILLGSVGEVRGKADVDGELSQYLSSGRKYFASDTEVADAVQVIPFYQTGRAKQRKLVLQWLEESYGSREPVEPAGLTIEHVLPQRPVLEWEEELAPDLHDGETFGEVHQALSHTLGNLTLTGYNATLSNSSFSKKRELLVASGLRMNQEIASADRWGRAAILERSAQLAERIARIWPGPVGADASEGFHPLWERLSTVITRLPAGSWTTYGDLASLVGSHVIPVGRHIASRQIENTHRVLEADGSVSSKFIPRPSDRDEVRRTLEAEGVRLDENGLADPAQRVDATALAQYVADEVDEPVGQLTIPEGQDPRLSDNFVEQLVEQQSPDAVQAVLSLIWEWTSIGGKVSYGTANTTSCFLYTRGQTDDVWAFIIYPDGSIEVSFQRLAIRPPFDDVTVRDDLRRRLNEISGVSIAEERLAKRPSIRHEILISEESHQKMREILQWFYDRAALTQ